jgi:hypothetical protein
MLGEDFERKSRLALPVRVLPVRARPILRFGLAPQILQIHQHDARIAGCQKGLARLQDLFALRGIGIQQPSLAQKRVT